MSIETVSLMDMPDAVGVKPQDQERAKVCAHSKREELRGGECLHPAKMRTPARPVNTPIHAGSA